MKLSWGAASHAGRVRRTNQDATLAGPTVFAVADGMGGHAAGDVASALAVGVLAGLGDEAELTPTEVVEALAEANRRIAAQAQEGNTSGMGTTVAGVAVVTDGEGAQLMVFNVGDSRVYRQRNGELVQLSLDHSVIAELLRDGQITAEEALTHPERHTITRALGLETQLETDWHLEPIVEGDRFLICTDGLFNEVDTPALADELSSGRGAAASAQQLVEASLAHGARDNVSAVVVDVVAPPEPIGVGADASEETVPRG